MVKNTSIALVKHINGFITSEVVRAGLRLLENNETKLEALRTLLTEGEKSGLADYSYDAFVAELDEPNY